MGVLHEIAQGKEAPEVRRKLISIIVIHRIGSICSINGNKRVGNSVWCPPGASEQHGGIVCSRAIAGQWDWVLNANTLSTNYLSDYDSFWTYSFMHD